jgi:hypothetical protein
MFTYLIDSGLKASIIILFVLLGLGHEIFNRSYAELDRYVILYTVTVITWGLLLIKYVLLRRQVFTKTRLDLFFMGLLILTFLSALLADDRVRGVFGSINTWHISVITFMSIAILYYVCTLVFRYGRGMKWLIGAFVLSLFIPGVYFANSVIRKNSGNEPEFIIYTVVALPLLISTLFVFRKIVVRIICFATLLVNLFLISYYADGLKGPIFAVSVGVLALFLVFYFWFWIRNYVVISSFVKGIAQRFKQFQKLKSFINSEKRTLTMILFVIFMALWIIGFGVFTGRYFINDIKPDLGSWYSSAFDKMHGVRMWLIGGNNLSQIFSGIEVLSILGNYGIFAALIFLGFLVYSIFATGKLACKFLRLQSFRNTIIASSMFVTMTSLFVFFVLSSFNSMLYLAFLFIIVLYAIIVDLLDRKEPYSLSKCAENKNKKILFISFILVIAILTITVYGFAGIFVGLDHGIFIR